MMRYLVAVILIWAGPLSSTLQAPKHKAIRNVIRGVVVSITIPGSTSTVSNAIAIAYLDEGTPVSVSEPTKADGTFELVVPEDVSSFKLEIHDKGARYWDYRPSDFVANRSHPHDVGQITLTDKHDLSLSEIRTQVEAATLLHQIQEASANDLIEKVAYVYARMSTPVNILACGGSKPPTEVSYENVMKPLFLETSNDVEPVTVAEQQLNARLALNALPKLVRAESIFFQKNGRYEDVNQLIKAGLLERSALLTKGYCLNLHPGNLAGSSFHPSLKGPFNYYILTADPDPISAMKITVHSGVVVNRDARIDDDTDDVKVTHVPLYAGFVRLYATPDGRIRYSMAKTKIQSLKETLPIPKDFPLGIKP
jgi:hypothetical protein